MGTTNKATPTCSVPPTPITRARALPSPGSDRGGGLVGHSGTGQLSADLPVAQILRYELITGSGLRVGAGC